MPSYVSITIVNYQIHFHQLRIQKTIMYCTQIVLLDVYFRLHLVLCNAHVILISFRYRNIYTFTMKNQNRYHFIKNHHPRERKTSGIPKGRSPEGYCPSATPEGGELLGSSNGVGILDFMLIIQFKA